METMLNEKKGVKQVMDKKYYTLDVASEMTSISTQTLRKKIKEGKLKAYKYTNAFWVLPDDLKAFLEKNGEYKPEKTKSASKRPLARGVRSVKKVSKKKPVRAVKKAHK